MKKRLQERLKTLEKKVGVASTAIAGRGKIVNAQNKAIEEEISFLKDTLKEGEKKNWFEKLTGK